MRLGMAINNGQVEMWFEKEFEPRADVINITEENTEADLAKLNIDGLIILRKNRNGGIKDPVALVKKYVKANPKGIILFIAGLIDDEGTEMIKQMEKLAFKVFVVASPHGRMSEKEIRKGTSDLLEEWEICNTNVYHIFGPKGGCGATTIIVYFANYLATIGSVAIVESKSALEYYKLKENIDVFQRDNLTSEELRELQKTHHYVLLDSIIPETDKRTYFKKIMVMDNSPESIAKAKNIVAESIILNYHCPNIFPKEIIEKEIGKSISLVVEDNRIKFLTALATGDNPIENIETIL